MRRPRGVGGSGTSVAAGGEADEGFAPAAVARMRSEFDTFLYDDGEAATGHAAATPARKATRTSVAPAKGVGGVSAAARAVAAKAAEALQARCRSLEGDVLRLTATLTQKEDALAQMHLQLEQEKMAREDEVGVKTLESEQQDLAIADLERQKRFLSDRVEATQKELAELQAELLRTRQTLGERNRALEQERRQLKAKLGELQHAEGSRGRDQSHREQLLQTQLAMRQGEVADLHGEIDRLKGVLTERNAEIEGMLASQADVSRTVSMAAPETTKTRACGTFACWVYSLVPPALACTRHIRLRRAYPSLLVALP